MKYIISILCLSCMLSSYAQDTTNANLTFKLKELEKGGLLTGVVIADTSYQTAWITYKKDTVKCIMQVCDTSLHKWIVPFHYGFQVDTSSSLNSLALGVTGYDIPIFEHEESAYDYSLRWMNGYRVKTVKPTYLDENKKPLNKNFIVWQSKSL